MKRFPAKILLFGEYGLLYGAKALAVPFNAFGGQLQMKGATPSPDAKEYVSFLEIDRFVSFFEYHDLNKEMHYALDMQIIKEDLQKGLYFESTIPLGYGVGSSGALCAAIFDEYSVYHTHFDKFSRNKDILKSLKNDFSVLERYFHGASSGIDPLVSFLGRPVLFHNGSISIVDFSVSNQYAVFLVDTKVRSNTGPLVENFRKKMNDEGYKDQFIREYLPVNDAAIDAILSGDIPHFFASLRNLVPLQLEHFREMIPSNFVEQIQKEFEEEVYFKLLGSGGGGYLLAFVPNGKKIQTNSPLLKYEVYKKD